MRGACTSAALVVVTLGLLGPAAACDSGTRPSPTPTAVGDGAVTVGAFDFAESALLAELYAQALEHEGVPIERTGQIGPREVVAPALVRGLVELVPEYAGTALSFLSLGAAEPEADPTVTHAALREMAATRGLVALSPAPAQDANAFVVSRATARRLGLADLSDLAAVAPELTFGGPPECPSRPLCLEGLRSTYGIEFGSVLALDVGGPQTRTALKDGAVDVALLFTTDAALASDDLVVLADDRALQPAENVTPLVRQDAFDRWGPELTAALDAVSQRLSTDELRRLNARLAEASPDQVAREWLASEGLA